MNIKLQQYLFHSILGFLLVIGSASAFAGAEVEQTVDIDGECVDYPNALFPHAFCWEGKYITTEVETPSGNIIYQRKGDYTEAYHRLIFSETEPGLYVMERTPYFEIVDNRTNRTIKKAGDFGDHVNIETDVSEYCGGGTRYIVTAEYRFVNGQVIRDNTEYDEIAC